MPDGQELSHPVLLIGNDNYGYEEYYIGVIMSSTEYKDRYSYHCNDDMFDRPLFESGSCIRQNLIVGLRLDEIKKMVNQMKKPFLREVLKNIADNLLVISK